MQQHVLDQWSRRACRVGRPFRDWTSAYRSIRRRLRGPAVERDWFEHVTQLIGQFRRERGEIIHEIQRVLDLVRDACGELAERG